MPKKQTRRKDGIFTRPDSPFWWACIPKGTGGSTRRSTGISPEDDPQGIKALAVRAQWLAEGEAQATGEGATFDDLMLIYLETVSPTKRSPERDRWSAKALQPVFTGRTLKSIGAAQVREYIAGRIGEGIAPGTVNKEIGLMSAALNWARRELEWEVPNPWQSRRQREPAGRERWLTQEEARALVLATERRGERAAHLVDFIVLGLNTGMRPGEMLNLEWDRVDLPRCRVEFGALDQKNGRSGQVPLNREAREALLSRARFRATHCPDASWVFCTKDGERIVNIRKGFGECVRAAGLTDVHPHDLRRTCGSWLLQAGVGIERVSELLRHADVAITQRVYARLRPSDVADAVAVLDQEGIGFSRSFSRSPAAGGGRKRKPAATG
jgi:integrase